jgi:poly(A) polymerase
MGRMPDRQSAAVLTMPTASVPAIPPPGIFCAASTGLSAIRSLTSARGPSGADAAGRRDWLRRLALLAPARDRAEALAMAERLRLSKTEAARLADFAEPPAPFEPGLTRAARREALYRMGRDRAWDLALLGASRADAAGEDATPWEDLMQEAADWQHRDLPVSGADALAQGLTPGPQVGASLAAVERWWIDRDFAPDRTECLERLEQETARLKQA